MRPKTLRRRVGTACLIGAAGLLLLAAVAHAFLQRPLSSDHAIHIAFGFHVNLYHSFRNDTNDASGFGQDIRVIRHIIDALDRLNAQGVPVKGVWDFDNLFSLEEILPRHAPDIIEAIQRRVRHHGDEVILMSYNNGMVSAMTADELRTAMAWAVSNPQRSGVADLFDTYSPIVRPQEMMTTPGSFAIYREMGIQAVALYYSATPFDAFRVFTRPLSPAEAHNPILYHDPRTGEEMTIVPTYHFGDLVDQVSLRRWVNRLRALQLRGELNHDALIFINYDADSELWGGIDLPRGLRWLPNTGGIEALVREVSDLEYVRFTTVGEYLADRPPVGTFHFGQDTADGSFNGYSSWAEKADATRYWTSIERNRRVCAAARRATALSADDAIKTRISAMIEQAVQLRLRALSTTHFGMATPFLAAQRQEVADALLTDLDRLSENLEQALRTHLQQTLNDQAPSDDNRAERLDTLMVIGTSPAADSGGHRFISMPLPAATDMRGRFHLTGTDGVPIVAVPLGITPDRCGAHRHLFYIDNARGLADGVYGLYRSKTNPANNALSRGAVSASHHGLANQRLTVRLDHQGEPEGIYLDGRRQVEAGSLLPHLVYAGRRIEVTDLVVTTHTAADGGSATLALSGTLPAPGADAISNGRMVYRLSVAAHLPYLFLEGRLTYPATATTDRIKPGVPGLERTADLRWEETAPAEIRFAPRATPRQPPRVLKHNYLGVTSAYALDYFRHDRRNLDLDNVNNHITATYAAVVADRHGLALAMDTGLQANFAFAPMRMAHEADSDTLAVKINPFGTYHGRQYRPPTTGNGHGFEATLQAGEQFAASAPTFNGVSQNFGLMLAFFHGPELPADLQRDLIAYARQPLVFSMRHVPAAPSRKETTAAAPCGQIEHRQADARLQDDNRIRANKTVPAHQPEMPLLLGLRVVWANLRALLAAHFR
ncbi:hypothetical protein [Desulfatitalea alkaliphila]|uniref:Glycoside hydrolase family 57 N-terminal domain-containing protein n=1 Tax=Desulfatitalea alkaliphila TaxID=2929485 RepID=A0AA41R1F2_9BACT|nr:hypothetical protein [Desulfatitalea alkaliphila]MCJ8500259.1 hypothetical protein [Desulfatitalea alkaliphila]